MMQDNKIQKAVIFTLAILGVFLLVKTVTEMKEFVYVGPDPAARNMISVLGEGEVLAVPDIAMFTFGVTKEATTVAKAQELSAESVNRAIDFLKERGIEEKDIRTVNYSVYPRYEYNKQLSTRAIYPPEGDRTLVGFEVSQSIEVKVRDTAKAGELLSGIGEIGATNISGLSFEVDDEDGLIAEAREKAIEDAKDKAAELAKQLGVKIVRIVSFNENGSPYYARGLATYGEVYGMGGGDDAVAPSIPTGENKYVSNVSITYEIR
ncbi:MAG: SIMPL domain-containing protein [bacterium]|nr:SIMPL domain-containing protein [bacterium]